MAADLPGWARADMPKLKSAVPAGGTNPGLRPRTKCLPLPDGILLDSLKNYRKRPPDYRRIYYGTK